MRLLMTETIERAGTKAGTKGFEYAISAIEMATFMRATGKAAQSGFRTEIKSSGQGRNMTRFGGMSGVPMPRLMAKRPVQGSLLDDKDHRAKCRLRCGELHSRPGRDNHTQ